jgi:hypothetical protein
MRQLLPASARQRDRIWSWDILERRRDLRVARGFVRSHAADSEADSFVRSHAADRSFGSARERFKFVS